MIGGIKGNGRNGRQMEKLTSKWAGREGSRRQGSISVTPIAPARILESGLGALGGWTFFQGN